MIKNFNILYDDIAILPKKSRYEKGENSPKWLWFEGGVIASAEAQIKEIAILSPDRKRFVFVSEIDKKLVRKLEDYVWSDGEDNRLTGLYEPTSITFPDGRMGTLCIGREAVGKRSSIISLETLKTINRRFVIAQQELVVTGSEKGESGCLFPKKNRTKAYLEIFKE